jgi:hypothetical protein
VIRSGLLLVFVVLSWGCAAQPAQGWEFELERQLEGRRDLFAGGAKILRGRADLDPTGSLRVGDEALYGVCLDVGGSRRIWYLHLRVLEVKVRRWMLSRRTLPYESRLRAVPAVSRARLPKTPEKFVSLDDLLSDMRVAHIRAEVFDAEGRSHGAAASYIAAERLMNGLRPAARAGFAQQDLMRGRVALGRDAEIIRLGDLTGEARRDLRTVTDGQAAIAGFFRVLKSNPATRDLLFQVVALPSLWSMITTLRIRASMSVDFFDSRPVADARFAAAGGGLWSFPLTLQLNQQPALIARVVVGQNGAPNGIAGGVYAVVGQHPRDSNRRIHLELIATRRGPAVSD